MTASTSSRPWTLLGWVDGQGREWQQSVSDAGRHEGWEHGGVIYTSLGELDRLHGPLAARIAGAHYLFAQLQRLAGQVTSITATLDQTAARADVAEQHLAAVRSGLGCLRRQLLPIQECPAHGTAHRTGCRMCEGPRRVSLALTALDALDQPLPEPASR